MKYILGIDAGATNTIALIADEKGKILGRGEAGPANVPTIAHIQFEANIHIAVRDAAKQAGMKEKVFIAAVAGVAGIDSQETQKKVRVIIKKALNVNDNKLMVVNDTRIVIPTCSNRDWGVAVIAGTGSHFYGVNKKGEEASTAGMEYLFSDEGSGYWIGALALRAVVRAIDGRGPRTNLEKLVLKKFNIKNIRELLDVIFKEKSPKLIIAGVSQLVDEAYKKGDKVATQILENAADEIALGVNTIINRLKMGSDDVDIVAIGGVFQSSYPFREKIQKKLTNKKAKFMICDKDPARGALKLALKLSKHAS